jgi:protein SCO1
MNWLPHPRALVIPAVLGLLLLALVGYRGWTLSQARALDDFGDAPSFALTDQLDRTVRSDDLRGKIVVADFIYTNCPDVCPLLSFHMKELQEQLRREGLLGSRVQLLSFTTDPAQDTPSVLRAYAERYQADAQSWRFLTGREEEMTSLIEHGFHLAVQRVPMPGESHSGHDSADSERPSYEVMHGSRFALLDQQWRIRGWYDGQDLDIDRVVRDVRQLLR